MVKEKPGGKTGFREDPLKPEIVIALAGNPNSGKTTIFNELTGSRQHVGNYPGVTVEHREGSCRYRGQRLRIIDLPGTYSLTACSAEEMVARNIIIDEKPDVVIDIIDSSNLERNLYLAVQLMELGVALVLAFNMSDEAENRGLEIDIEEISRRFGVPIVRTIGHRGTGLAELLDAAVGFIGIEKAAHSGDGTEKAPEGVSPADPREDRIECAKAGQRAFGPIVDYGQDIEEEVSILSTLLDVEGKPGGGYDPRWLALNLLENDRELRRGPFSPAVRTAIEQGALRIEAAFDEAPESAIAGRRYGLIADICRKAVRSPVETGRTVSDKMDAILANRVAGIPIFLGLMFLSFHLTFTLGEPLARLIEWAFGRLGGAISALWPEGSGGIVKSLLVDGVIGGVGGVLVFLPNILLLFLAIAVLEDSGYMARAAFLMDRLMQKIGLQGKSFIPMLLGFGCSVPAIMATRTLEDRRDRLATMLVIPLMSCGARLTIYALIIPAFFPQPWRAPMLWLIYIIGILLAILSVSLLRRTILKGEAAPFVMELPPYRFPAPKSVLIHMWEHGRMYVKKAGTVIFSISVVLWAMSTFPRLPREQTARFQERRQEARAGLTGASIEHRSEAVRDLIREEREEALRHSLAGRLGRALEPALKPMGFDWKIGTALIGAFAAKEVFVAQLGIVYSAGGIDEGSETLRMKLRSSYSPLVGFCVMLFCLIGWPCMATIAVTRRESGSWRWALFQLGGLTFLAYVITVVVYQAGRLLRIGVA